MTHLDGKQHLKESKKMTISKNICEVTTSDSNDFIMYAARCNCIGSEHTQHIILELDKHNTFTATFYYDCILSQYYLCEAGSQANVPDQLS